MKALLVNGSPHKNGCTHTALNIVGDSLRENGIEVDEFWIGNKPIAGCIGCGTCSKGEGCVYKDDKVAEFQSIAGDYDAFVFGSPVYYAGVAGSMKSFMDRAFYSNRGNVSFARKPAAVIASARRGGTTATLEQLEKHLQITQMYQVTSCYWPMIHGNTPEETVQDEEGVQTMQVLGANMAWLMKALEAARAAGIEEPPAIKKARTNFIR